MLQVVAENSEELFKVKNDNINDTINIIIAAILITLNTIRFTDKAGKAEKYLTLSFNIPNVEVK
jgi:hypothetical protein